MSNSEKYFLYVGNAYPHKNLERLIEGVIMLNSGRDEKIKLKIVAGRSVFIERLKNKISGKGVEDMVELVGFTKEPELKELYKNSVAFVFPTLEEGFGLPPMEAI